MIFVVTRKKSPRHFMGPLCRQLYMCNPSCFMCLSAPGSSYFTCLNGISHRPRSFSKFCFRFTAGSSYLKKSKTSKVIDMVGAPNCIYPSFKIWLAICCMVKGTLWNHGFSICCCCFSFHFCSSFVVIHHSVFFIAVLHSFPGYFAMPPALHPGFSGPWRPPPALSSTLATFDCLWFFIYRERYGFEWELFTHRRFLPYAPFPTFLTQPAFIKASLGGGSSSLRFAGLRADSRNTDTAHLFVWFTAIRNLDIQKNSFLNSLKYYHEFV